MHYLKTLALLAFSFSANAEYMFKGTHPYKLRMIKDDRLVLSICYQNRTECRPEIEIGQFEDLSRYLQEKIWRRKDVNLNNYEQVLRESLAIVESKRLEVKRREKIVADLSKNEEQIKTELKEYVDSARGKLTQAEYTLQYLIENKKVADEVIEVIYQTLSSGQRKTYQHSFEYDFENHQWNYCSNFKKSPECFESGIQFFLSKGKNPHLLRLLEKSLQQENKKSGFPYTLSSGLKIGLLTTNLADFGKNKFDQNATKVTSKLGGDDYKQCSPTQTSGSLVDTQLNCGAFGKNWRYPTLKELQSNRSELLKILQMISPTKYLHTGEVKPFPVEGAIHLSDCKTVYYNLTKNITINNHNSVFRDSFYGKEPKLGASGICVCSNDCEKK